MKFSFGGRGWPLLLLSMVSLCCADPTQTCDITAQSDFVRLPHSQAQRLHSTAGPLKPLYGFARSFLDAVQPNPFPKEILQRAVDEGELDATEVAGYEAGYIVCLILAVLYIILMPALGGVYLWRHYRGNSGEVTLSSLSSWPHWGIAVVTCLAATTILLLAGVILAFATNSRTRENMEPGLYYSRISLRDMEQALDSIPEKIARIIEEYSVPKADLEEHFNGIGDDVGQEAIMLFDPEANRVLSELSVSSQEAVGAIKSLQDIQTLRSKMVERHTQLQDQLAELRQGLEQTRTSCPDCSLPSTDQLRTDSDYSQIPSVERQLRMVPPVSRFTGLVEKANASFHGIPQIFTNQTTPSVKALKTVLEDIMTSLNDSSQQFPSLRSLSDVVSDARHAVAGYGRRIDHYDYQRWAVAVTFCTLILLIVVLTVVGLALGLSALYCPDLCPSPGHGQLERMAVTLLRVSVVLTLIFSWLFIILVFITLFFGGNAHTLGCRSWKNGEIFEFLDQNDDLFRSLNFSQPENSSAPLVNLSTAEIYHGCRSGRSLFQSMELGQLFDLEDFLNMSKYMVGFRQSVHNVSINLEDQQPQLLTPEGREDVQSFQNSGIDTINYAAFETLLSRPVVQTNLTVVAEQLDLAAQAQENEVIRTDLESSANKTKEVNKLAQQQEQDAQSLNTSVKALAAISRNYKANIDKALQSIRRLQQELQTSVPGIVGNVSQCILHKGESSLAQYLEWVRHTILNEILECRWLAVSLDNVYTALCENVVDPWNAFWLCLGWCCVFLIPAVIFSLCTANLLKPAPSHLSTANHVPLDFGLPIGKEEPKEEPNEQPEEKTGKSEPNVYMTLTKINDLRD